MNPPGASTKSRELLRFARLPTGALLVHLGIGLGLLVGPILFRASARPSPSRQGAHGVQTDIIPRTQEIATTGDLLLEKRGEQIADALAAFSEGLIAEENADGERALEAYRRSLLLDPGNTDLAVKIAFELARRGEVPEGINLLKDAAKAAPKDSIPLLCLSQLYAKYLRKPDLAERYAQAALALAPDTFPPYLTLYELYTAQGEKKRAEAVLERAFRSSSDDAQFWLQLGELEAQAVLRGRNPAPDALAHSPQTLQKINACVEKALAHAKNDPEIFLKIADFYVLTRQNKLAIPLYEKAAALAKNPKSEEALAVRNKLASAYLANGQREQAAAALESLVKDSPTRYETYETLGQLYAADGEIGRAIANYQQALLIDGTQPINYLRIAELQIQEQKAEDAVKTLLAARARFPGLPQISYLLGVALTQAKEAVKALMAFDQALHEGETSHPALLDSNFYFRYGAAAEQAGHLDKAAEMLRKSIELEPANAANAYNYLGYMWADRGIHLEEATELIRRALELEPENGAFLDSLGWCFYRAGDYPQALIYIQKAIERVQPADAVVYDHLGDVQAALGKPEEALAAWKKALELDPGNKELQKKAAGKNEPPAAPE